jgi:serine/threonine-protein kinase HipA
MARVRQLASWLHGERVAALRRTGVGNVSLEYLPDVVDRYSIGTPLLSCSLPVRRGRQAAWPFVTGLLPEGHHRVSMSLLAGVDTLDALGMLARFGRDVAGAVVVAADDYDLATAGAPGIVDLTDDELMADVARLPARSLALHDDSELSLAGLEDKLLLVRTNRGWARPVHGYPSTHILKVDNRVHRGTVIAEHDCLQLARRAGIAAPNSELTAIGDADCIIVERYDRAVAKGGHVTRVHQEDSCQALGVDPAAVDGRAKYEQHGGPSLAQIAGLLNAYAADPSAELTRLLERLTFTLVIGDADAHGKNISLLHHDPAHISLAPLYDTVPTALWPNLRPTAAMRVNGRDRLPDISADDLVLEARRWGIAERHARATIARGCDRLREAARDVPRRNGLPLKKLVVGNATRLGR